MHSGGDLASLFEGPPALLVYDSVEAELEAVRDGTKPLAYFCACNVDEVSDAAADFGLEVHVEESPRFGDCFVRV